ncbi:oxidoreductase [Salarchaeum sp. JOR-1]|uniref:DUF7093 family protein n=1 Tax=Salarchaeum sp. JOR-1 TaxID=2599399 RepID=UPI0011988E6F|nr:oxidoreductase [Salarchaeum sp. JOR-1]QDX39937.1 oxidoreductase [Salarchaeum sp. JOR-1]
MGLRCSLLGHDFGEPEVEREREERGNEVVETVREVKVCERCGSESVVSENTEVRSIKPDPRAENGSAHVEPDAETASPSSHAPDLEAAVTRVSEDDPGDASSGDAGVSGEFGDVSAEEDDGVILSDDDESDEAEVPADREPGQWPDAGDTRQDERAGTAANPSAVPDEAAGDADGGAEVIDADAESEPSEGDTSESEHSPWPDVDGDDEGFDAKPGAGGGVEFDESGQAAAQAEHASEDEDVEYVEAGFESTGSLDPEHATDADGTELVCPQCGHRTAVSGSSLRAGDICPECRKGYLAEQ